MKSIFKYNFIEQLDYSKWKVFIFNFYLPFVYQDILEQGSLRVNNWQNN